MSFQRFRVSGATPSTTIQTFPTQGMAPVPPAPRQPPAAHPTSGGHFQGVSFRVQMPADISGRISASSSSSTGASPGGSKAPYGSGDSEYGYTHTFPTMDVFREWREKEEIEKMVEFVKSDAHASKAQPPRFKEHTKLVCGRHGKNGRKKYEKKFPGRKRKVPSMKIDGEGCPASISYKTYHGTEEVRVSYVPEHSHPIGEANLLFTKRGRKLLASRYEKPQSQTATSDADTNGNGAGTGDEEMADAPAYRPPQHIITGPSSFSLPLPYPHVSPPRPNGHARGPNGAPPPHPAFPRTAYNSAVSLIAPLPPHPDAFLAPHGAGAPSSENSGERWDRLETLFQSVRGAARTFAFPGPSVAALESVLIRLYLESPVLATMGVAPAVLDAGLAGAPDDAGVAPQIIAAGGPPTPTTPSTPVAFEEGGADGSAGRAGT